YQLVLRRKVDFSSGWVILPVETSKEWTELFGKKSADWLSLCNKLLDKRLSLDSYSLEKLDADLAKLKPKTSPLVTVVPAVAGVLLVVGAGLFWFLHQKSFGTLVVRTDPPGAVLIVAPMIDGIEVKESSQTNTTPLDGSPLKFSFGDGDYRLRVRYEG